MKIITETNTVGLDFISGTESPVVLFDSFSKMFTSIININTELIKKVDPLIDVQILLLDIKHGSIFSDYIKKILIPEKEDNVTAYPDVKGDVLDYSEISQSGIIDTLSEAGERIIKNDKINEIHEKIMGFSSVTGVDANLNYRPPNKITLANAIDLLGESTKMLAIGDKYYFQNKSGEKEIRKIYTDIDYNELKREMSKKIVEHPIHLRLKIKIADFLGKSRWKFKLENNTTIEAKILDKEWLEKFHLKIETIGPGDSIEISGTVTDIFDDFGNRIDSQYTILKVIKVHRPNEQRELEF
ncbi:MAG: hypothetical protein LBL44_11860 [Treponema sp.]|jgi:hypothetical protein|nr:hypothetical protein [Treponema sp.]